jgi:hypothetical protein
MIDAEYWPRSEGDVCCLSKHEWNIPKDSLQSLAQDVVTGFDILSVVETLGLSAIFGDLDHIKTDFYDAPFAPDPRYDDPFVTNPRNVGMITQPVASLTGPVQSRLVRTDGLGLPFPVLGWLRVEWVRVGATRHLKIIPKEVRLVQVSTEGAAPRTEAKLGISIQTAAIRQDFDGEAGHNSVGETQGTSGFHTVQISAPINMGLTFNLSRVEAVLTSEDTLQLRFTLIDKQEPQVVPCTPSPQAPCPKPPATIDSTATLVADTTLNLAYTYDSTFTYSIRSPTAEGVAGPEYAEFTYHVIEERE